MILLATWFPFINLLSTYLFISINNLISYYLCFRFRSLTLTCSHRPMWYKKIFWFFHLVMFSISQLNVKIISSIFDLSWWRWMDINNNTLKVYFTGTKVKSKGVLLVQNLLSVVKLIFMFMTIAQLMRTCVKRKEKRGVPNVLQILHCSYYNTFKEPFKIVHPISFWVHEIKFLKICFYICKDWQAYKRPCVGSNHQPFGEQLNALTDCATDLDTKLDFD